MRIPTGLRGLRVIRTFRTFRAVGVMLLLGVWSLNPSLYFLKSLIGHEWGLEPGQGTGTPEATSAIAANSIHAPRQEKEICLHHSHGCPMDCFCPKIQPEQGGDPDVSGESAVERESLHQPVLVQCTEDNAAAGPPTGGAALAVPIGEIPLSCPLAARCPTPLVPSPLEMPQEPPLKIPIA